MGNYAYLANGSRGLLVVNVSNPASPTQADVFDTPYGTWSLAVAGNYAYLADGAGGLRIIDVSSPTNVVEVGFYITGGDLQNVTVAGNYAYIGSNSQFEIRAVMSGGTSSSSRDWIINSQSASQLGKAW
jgi:hypothetical protein